MNAAVKPSEKQLEASNPSSNVWVNANAGSGKTHVLVDRVIRLMLGGTEPSRIMCLTFTKAAAAEMASGDGDAARLFAVDILASLRRLDGGRRMPAVAGRDQHGVDIFAIEQLAEIAIQLAVAVAVMLIDHLKNGFNPELSSFLFCTSLKPLVIICIW
mgnify:CR=1 FL=1